MENYSKHVGAGVPKTPDYFVIDQGSAYTLTEMRGIVEAFETCLYEAPIETPGAIGCP